MAKYVIKKEWECGTWLWSAYDEDGKYVACSSDGVDACEEALRRTLENKSKSEVVKELEI